MPDLQVETTFRSDPHPKGLEYLGLFQEVTRMITATLDIEEVLELIASKVPEIVGVDASTIRLLGQDIYGARRLEERFLSWDRNSNRVYDSGHPYLLPLLYRSASVK